MTTTITLTQQSEIILPFSREITLEERVLRLFTKLQHHQDLPPEVRDLLGSLAKDFQIVSQKTLILAKLYWEILPLKQQLGDTIFEEGEMEVNQILELLLPQGTKVIDYLNRYKQMQLKLKMAEALQTTFEKKKEEAVNKAKADMAIFFEQAEARKVKIIELHQAKSKLHANAVKQLQEKSAKIEAMQQNTEKMGHEVQMLNQRMTLHDQKLALELQKLKIKEGGM